MDVKIHKLSKHYRRSVRALDEVDLNFGDGMTGLLGSNGAGKTTLMRIITGILRPTYGSITIGTHDLGSRAGRVAVKRFLGYLPQELDLYPDLTGREFLDYLALLKGVDGRSERHTQIDMLLDLVGLSDVANRRIKGYSGGMKRRIGIAQAMLGDPRLIVVDEPTAGLDPEERMRFRALLAGLGAHRTVVLSTHILEDVSQTCPNVAVLAKGRVVYQGLTSGLVDAARGRTFSMRTAGVPPTGALDVVNARVTSEGTFYRIVADAAPAGAEELVPTLEDGYVALMRSTRTFSTPSSR